MTTLRTLRNLAVLVILAVAIPSLRPGPAAGSSLCSACYLRPPGCSVSTTGCHKCGAGFRIYLECYDRRYRRCCIRPL